MGSKRALAILSTSNRKKQSELLIPDRVETQICIETTKKPTGFTNLSFLKSHGFKLKKNVFEVKTKFCGIGCRIQIKTFSKRKLRFLLYFDVNFHSLYRSHHSLTEPEDFALGKNQKNLLLDTEIQNRISPACFAKTVGARMLFEKTVAINEEFRKFITGIFPYKLPLYASQPQKTFSFQTIEIANDVEYTALSHPLDNPRLRSAIRRIGLRWTSLPHLSEEEKTSGKTNLRTLLVHLADGHTLKIYVKYLSNDRKIMRLETILTSKHTGNTSDDGLYKVAGRRRFATVEDVEQIMKKCIAFADKTTTPMMMVKYPTLTGAALVSAVERLFLRYRKAFKSPWDAVALAREACLSELHLYRADLPPSLRRAWSYLSDTPPEDSPVEELRGGVLRVRGELIGVDSEKR